MASNSAEIRLQITSPADTAKLATLLASQLPAGSVVCLTGTLGAGKTYLVQSLCEALGIPRESVNSPTFVICHTYAGARAGNSQTVHHFDLYRVRDDDEFFELGVEELLESRAISLLEWGEKFQHLLPERTIFLELELVSGAAEARKVTIRSNETSAAHLLTNLQQDFTAQH